jgi:hypothetical protein
MAESSVVWLPVNPSIVTTGLHEANNGCETINVTVIVSSPHGFARPISFVTKTALSTAREPPITVSDLVICLFWQAPSRLISIE